MNVINHNFKRIIIAFCCILSALPISAGDCSKTVERIINECNNAAKIIQACKTPQEFSSLDHNEITGNIDLGVVASQCGDYVLSENEKRRLIRAYENLIYTVIAKMHELLYPDISKEMFRNALKPSLDIFKQLTLNSRTLGEWIKSTYVLFQAMNGKNKPSAGNNASTSPQTNIKGNSSPIKLRVSDIQDLDETLPPQGSNTYYAKNMFDGKATTGWGVNLDNFYGCCDHRWGPTFTINAKKIDHIKILNGYAKSNTTYLNNTRAKWIVIYRVDEEDEDNEFIDDKNIIYSGPLKDVNTFQTLKVDSRFDNTKPTKRVGLVFGTGDNGFYLGKKYRDLIISELEFYGEPQ